MRLISPETAPKFQLIDSHGKVVRLDSGKRTLLAFFVIQTVLFVILEFSN
jgi:hypothetical protein